MSITIPGLRRDRRTPRHKAADEVNRLRHQLAGAGQCIAGLRLQVAEAQAAEDRANAKAVRVDEAEARAMAAEQRLTAQDEELTALRQFKANVTSIDVPPGQRDVHPDDQPTTPVNVRPLWQALGIGPVHAVTDPGQTTWGRAREAEEAA